MQHPPLGGYVCSPFRAIFKPPLEVVVLTFTRKYGSYSSRFDAESVKVEKLKNLRKERLQKAEAVSAFMFEIHEQEQLVNDFNEKLWLATIDTVTVHHDGKLVFRLKNGMEVTK